MNRNSTGGKPGACFADEAGWRVARFGSLDEVREYLADAPVINDERDESRWQPPAKSWDLRLGWEGVDALLRDGWAEGAEQLAEIDEASVPVQVARRPARVRRPYGGTIHMGAYLSGEPHCMYARTPVAAADTVTVAYKVGYAHVVHADVVVAAGRRLLAWIDALERAGYRVRLEAVKQLVLTRVGIRVLVKDERQPLDIGAVATTIHPGFNRRAMLRLLEDSLRCTESYGEEIDRTTRPKWITDAGEFLYIPPVPHYTHTASQAEQHIDAVFEAFTKKPRRQHERSYIP